MAVGGNKEFVVVVGIVLGQVAAFTADGADKIFYAQVAQPRMFEYSCLWGSFRRPLTIRSTLV